MAHSFRWFLSSCVEFLACVPPARLHGTPPHDVFLLHLQHTCAQAVGPLGQSCTGSYRDTSIQHSIVFPFRLPHGASQLETIRRIRLKSVVSPAQVAGFRPWTSSSPALSSIMRSSCLVAAGRRHPEASQHFPGLMCEVFQLYLSSSSQSSIFLHPLSLPIYPSIY